MRAFVVFGAMAVGVVGCTGGGTEIVSSQQALGKADAGAQLVDLSAAVAPTSAQTIVEAAKARFRTPAVVDMGVPSQAYLELRDEDDAPLGLDDNGGSLTPRFRTLSITEQRSRLDQGAQVLLAKSAKIALQLSDRKTGLAAFVRLAGAAAVDGDVYSGYQVFAKADSHGGDVIRRPLRGGFEDFIVYQSAPAETAVRYEVLLSPMVAGLRLVANILELLDDKGAPRLRMAPPFLIDSAGARTDATISVEGCTVDTSTMLPWDRPTIDPGARRCTVAVTWDGGNVKYPAMLDPLWNTTGNNLAVGRFSFPSIAVPTFGTKGGVLVAGGFTVTGGGAPTATAEMFSTSSGMWASAGSVTVNLGSGNVSLAAGKSTLVQLTDGRVMLAGGETNLGGAVTKGVSIYTPSTGVWAPGVNLTIARSAATMTALPTGEILVAGGRPAANQAELFNAAATSVATTATLPFSRETATAILAPIGGTQRVLLFGGATGGMSPKVSYYYVPQNGGTAASWQATGSLSVVRQNQAGALMQDGRVVVGGGGGSAQVEIYDGANWNVLSGSMLQGGSGRTCLTATTLRDGDVVFTGGGPGTFGFSTYNDRLQPAQAAIAPSGALNTARGSHGAAALSDGRVLVMGGINAAGNVTTSSEAYLIPQGGSCSADSDCASGACTSGVCSGSSCTIDADCGTTGYCGTGAICSPKRANGGTATASTQCTSGFLVNGVCCNNACNGGCGRCDLPGTLGACSAAAAATVCDAVAHKACSGTATACPATITTNADCAPGYYAAGGACLAKKASAAAKTCGNGTECLSGLCVDGYCCNSACNSEDISNPYGAPPGCDSCAVPGHEGTCYTNGTGSCAMNVPPDPNLTAPVVSSDYSTDLASSTQFLYIGPNAVQTSETEPIDSTRASVLHGLVSTVNGLPLAGVTVSVLGKPTYGQTVSRFDGKFDLVVNGGTTLNLVYTATGFVSAQRQVVVPWNEFVAVPEVWLVLREASQPIDSSHRLIQGRNIGGAPRTWLYFPTGTQLSVDGGAWQSTFSISATENTEQNDERTMMATLPATTQFTYASEFMVANTTDASHVTFQNNMPLLWVKDMLSPNHFPTGSPAPIGSYATDKGSWQSESSGRVIKIVSVSGGVATVDTVGTWVDPVTHVAPSPLSLSAEELGQLGTKFVANDIVWRVPIPHFSKWDVNWGFFPPPGAIFARAPNAPPPAHVKNPCKKKHSIIECENQTLGEEIPIPGTDLVLNYRSDRQKDRIDERTIRIPLSTADIGDPNGIANGVWVEITVAGNDLLGSSGGASEFIYTWPGTDPYGRQVYGAVRARYRVGFSYAATYSATNAFGYNGGGNISVLQFPGRGSIPLILWSDWREQMLNNPDAFNNGLGGWTLNQAHHFDTRSRVLFKGDGDRQIPDERRIAVRAGGLPSGSDLVNTPHPALTAKFVAIADAVANDADDVFVLENDAGWKLKKIHGTQIATVLTPSAFPSATNEPRMAIDRDGSLLLLVARSSSNPSEIWRVTFGTDPWTAIVSTVATGLPSLGGGLNYFAVGPDGAAYYEDSSTVYRLDPLGFSPNTAAGHITALSGVNSINPNTAAENDFVNVRVGNDGSVYSAYQGGDMLKRIAPSGTLSVFAGATAGSGAYVEGGYANAHGLPYVPNRMTFGIEGSTYIASYLGGYLNRVGSDGIITSVTGFSRITSLAANASGSIYVADDAWGGGAQAPAIVRLSNDTPVRIPDRSGGEIYLLDSQNRHFQTIDSLTDKLLRTITFMDASSSRISQVIAADVDGGSRITQLTYDANNRVSGIAGPWGHTTTLGYDGDGNLSTIALPDLTQHSFGTSKGGLIVSHQDQRNVTQHYAYDSVGRLTSDIDGSGSTLTLALPTSAPFTNVTITKSSGAADRHDFVDSNYSQTRTKTELNTGLVSTSVTTNYLDNVMTSTTGAVEHWVQSPDPRLGPTAPFLSSYTLTEQGAAAPTYTVTTARDSKCAPTSCESPALCDSSAPNVLRLQTDTMTLPSDPQTPGARVATVVYDRCGGGSSYAPTITTTSPAGRTSTTWLDVHGRVSAVKVPGIGPTCVVYEPNGRPSALQQSNNSNGTPANCSTGRQVTFGYYPTAAVVPLDGKSGQLSTTTNSILGTSTQTTYNAYDGATNLTGLTLGLTTPGTGRVVGLGYDAAGNVKMVDPPGAAGQHQFGYEATGRLASYQAPLISTQPFLTEYAYDLDNRLKTVYRPGGDAVIFSYDPTTQRLTSVASALRSYTLGYEAVTAGKGGRLTSIQTSRPGSVDPETLTYALPATGSLASSATWSGTIGGSVGWTYDENFRVRTESVMGGQQAATYDYDLDGLIRQVSGPAGAILGVASDPNGNKNGRLSAVTLSNTTDARSYNAYGETATYASTRSTVNLYGATYDDAGSYQRDDLGRIKRLSESILTEAARTWDFGYDPNSGRLLTATEGGAVNATYTYAYDANGNRTAWSKTGTGAYSSSCTAANADDQLTNCTLAGVSTRYFYSSAGELIRRSNPTADTYFTYDAFGNLLKVDAPGTANDVEYILDGQNRRVGKRLGGALVKRWIWDGKVRIVAELDGAGTLQKRFVYATRANVPDFVVDVPSSTVYRVITDHLGSVRLIVPATGGGAITPTVRIDYDPFGNITTSTGSLSFAPFGFAGGQFDPDTGLLRFGARDYDPVLGRWLTKDPRRHGGGLNLYVYAYADPVNYVDVNGSFPWLAVGIAAYEAWMEYRAAATLIAVAGAVLPDDHESDPNALPALAMIYTGRVAIDSSFGLPWSSVSSQPQQNSCPPRDWWFGPHKSLQTWANQMAKRGWTGEQITQTLNAGPGISAPNMVNPGNPALRFVNPATGQFVVQDVVTNDILQISGQNFSPQE